MKLLCTTCQVEKPVTAFFNRKPYKEGGREYSYDCKECRRLNRRKNKGFDKGLRDELSSILFGEPVENPTQTCRRCGETKLKGVDFYTKKAVCISCSPLEKRDAYVQCNTCSLWHKKASKCQCNQDIRCIVCGAEGLTSAMFSARLCLKCKENQKLRTATKKYGLTVEKYEKILEDQGGCCKICKLPSTRRLAIDHDHQTGIVRGLLCVNCNLGLGNFQDNPELLEKAAEYLLNHQ